MQLESDGADAGGQIVIQLLRGASNEPKLGGVEILPVPPKLTAARLPGRVVISWSTLPGKSYQVQLRSRLLSAWSNLGVPLVAMPFSLAVTNNVSNLQVYYRVLQLN